MTGNLESALRGALTANGPSKPKELGVLMRNKRVAYAVINRARRPLPESYIREELEESDYFAEDDSGRFHLTSKTRLE